MLRNEDLKAEIQKILKDDHWTHDAVATRMGVAQPEISRILNRGVDKRLVEMMDTIGYDVEVRFVRKKRK